MEWTDEGIVLGARRHGEGSAIVELLTREHGRHLGLVRGGTSARMRPVLQPGNSVRAVWRARLDEHMGHYALEGLHLRAGAMLGLHHGAYGLTYLASLVRLLPERDPHEHIHIEMERMLDHFEDPLTAAADLVRFERDMIAELGFGLDLTRCAASGAREELVYVSPKSGCAVSRQAGLPWSERLLPLPAFLLASANEAPDAQAIADGFRLTGFFLMRHVLEPRGQMHADARAGFIAAALGRAHADPVAEHASKRL